MPMQARQWRQRTVRTDCPAETLTQDAELNEHGCQARVEQHLTPTGCGGLLGLVHWPSRIDSLQGCRDENNADLYSMLILPCSVAE